jgi:antitoxin HicB
MRWRLFASFPRKCCASGNPEILDASVDEAIANGEDAKRCWIAAMTEAGRPIRPPSVEPVEGCSGKWQLRAPRSLHRRLAEHAKCEGVSLNTLAVTLLAEGFGG